MSQKIFITGTDTHIGKTTFACSLLESLNQEGHKTIGLKPIASGCEPTPEGLRSEDALKLQKNASIQLPYELVNPVAYEPPIAPHLAAAQIHDSLSVKKLLTQCEATLKLEADFIVIEGCGGWLVPLNTKETMADFAKALDASVILVVGMRLGCINHALLTVESIQRSGVPLLGWIANCIDKEMKNLDDNIETLQQRIDSPLLGVLEFKNIPLS